MEDSTGNPSLKIILVGDSGVGKTSLINAYFNQPFSDQTQSTVAPAFCGTTVTTRSGKKLDLHIWDTAGQERFQSIGAVFYREAQVAFVCFEAKNIDSVDKWIKSVREQEPACVIFLVGMKSDSLSNDEITALNAQADKKVTEVQAKHFVLTSAQTGQGVPDLFSLAAELSNELSPGIAKDEIVEKKDGKCKC